MHRRPRHVAKARHAVDERAPPGIARRQGVKPPTQVEQRLGRDSASGAHGAAASSSFRPGAFTVPSPLTQA